MECQKNQLNCRYLANREKMDCLQCGTRQVDSVRAGTEGWGPAAGIWRWTQADHPCITHSEHAVNIFYIWLRAKRCANGGSDFWLPIKSVSNTLSCCCFVSAFIIGQYHSENNMSSKSGAAGEILFFESEKRHGIWPLKMDTLTVSAFDALIHVHDESKHYLSHQFAQRRYRFTQCI